MLTYYSVDKIKRIITGVNVLKRGQDQLKQVSIVAIDETGREFHFLLMGPAIEYIQVDNAGIKEHAAI